MRTSAENRRHILCSSPEIPMTRKELHLWKDLSSHVTCFCYYPHSHRRGVGFVRRIGHLYVPVTSYPGVHNVSVVCGSGVATVKCSSELRVGGRSHRMITERCAVHVYSTNQSTKNPVSIFFNIAPALECWDN